MEDSVDPETLYTKQNCIGLLLCSQALRSELLLTTPQAVVALERSTRGLSPSKYALNHP